MTEFANIELPLIVSSLTNPRKTFNHDKLTELAQSIKDSGVHQPVLVRPLPGSRVEETSWHSEHGKTLQRRDVRPIYELVCGERRLRASNMAGVSTIPAMIRDLTDEEVLEIQIIENLQRDDLSELEEAEGYQALMVHSQINADAVALKISKSRSYVFGRLKLLDLTDDSKQALRDGNIDASRAILIARIPDTKLQAKALAEATRKNGFDEVPSVRTLQTWLQSNVMLRLERASFNITDARLVKSAGSCKACPKRTGASPDLFADESDTDLCTDPACYKAKEAAHHDAVEARAEAKGMRLIEGKEAGQICSWNGKLNGYLPLSQVRDDATTLVGSMATGMKAPTLRDLLGKDGPKAVLIVNPWTKELIEAVPTEEAEAALVSKGLIKMTHEQVSKVEEAKGDIERIKGDTDRQVAKATRQAIYDAVATGVRGAADKGVAKLLGGDMLREWFLAQLGGGIDADDMAPLLAYTFQENEDEMDGITMRLRACSEADLLRALVMYIVSEDKPCYYNADSEPTIATAVAKSLELDTAAIAKAAKSDIKADIAARIKALQRELDAAEATQPALNTTAADASEGEGGQSAKPKASAPKASVRKPKLNAEQALSGIASAMQSAEDQATTASPDAHSTELAIGDAVTVISDLVALGPICRKWASKGGKVTKVMSGDCYQVKLNKGPSMPFYGSQITRAAA